MRQCLFAIACLYLSLSPAAADTVEMTRLDAINALKAIDTIAQYKAVAKQGGQDVVVDKYLDVTIAMRATLKQDYLALKARVVETQLLQEDAQRRLAHSATDLERELEAIALQKIKVDGLTLYNDADLHKDQNPQITIPLDAALSVLEAKP